MKRIILLIFLTGFGVISTVHGHDGATGIVRERMDVMGEIAKSLKTIGQMVKGEVSYDRALVKKASLEIKWHADKVSAMFPEGSNAKPSEALPNIWEDQDTFAKFFYQMKTESNTLANLAESAESVDEIKLQFVLVGKTCVGCHEIFRLNK